MTYEEREAIFSKEVLDLDDVMKLFDISRNEASRLMNAIRLKVGDRLGIKGKLHVEDYLLYRSENPPASAVGSVKFRRRTDIPEKRRSGKRRRAKRLRAGRQNLMRSPRRSLKARTSISKQYQGGINA